MGRAAGARGKLWTKLDLEEIAQLLNISPVEVQAAATFYTMYNVVEPVGEYQYSGMPQYFVFTSGC